MPDPMPRPVRILLQVIAYGAFAALIGYFSTAPAYRLRADNEAIVKLSFSHAAQLKQACRERTAEELAKLPPNMRNKLDCPRERADVTVELDMDGRSLMRAVVPPTGLRKDGAANLYRRIAIPSGAHTFVVRLADGPDGMFRFHQSDHLNLAPGQVLVVDFAPGGTGFQFLAGTRLP